MRGLKPGLRCSVLDSIALQFYLLIIHHYLHFCQTYLLTKIDTIYTTDITLAAASVETGVPVDMDQTSKGSYYCIIA